MTRVVVRAARRMVLTEVFVKCAGLAAGLDGVWLMEEATFSCCNVVSHCDG